MLAITVNAFYTTLRKRGTTRQLALAIMTCVIAALLLLLAVVWYNARFSSEQGLLSTAELTIVLLYVALWGWVVPLSIMTWYCLFTLPRDSNTSVRIPRHGKRSKTTRANTTAGAMVPPKRQPGVPAPFVFAEGVPWGWLEHRGGRFQGQRLALNRTVMTIGREEDNDIWLDDDTASRYHSELAWDQGQVYVTDCNSLNGVLLNGRRIRGSLLINSGDLLEVGSHRFLFERAELSSSGPLGEEDDPLLHYIRRSSVTSEEDTSDHVEVSLNILPVDKEIRELYLGDRYQEPSTPIPASSNALPTRPLEQKASDAYDKSSALLVICNGAMTGTSFLLDRPVLTIGSASESDVVINDPSVSRRHAQFLHLAEGDYVQDLVGHNGTQVNDKPLNAPHLLQKGDVVSLGNIHLEYTFVSEAHTTPLPPLPAPAPAFPSPSLLVRPLTWRVPLRLPSKPR